jgi:hypothetical protein
MQQVQCTQIATLSRRVTVNKTFVSEVWQSIRLLPLGANLFVFVCSPKEKPSASLGSNILSEIRNPPPRVVLRKSSLLCIYILVLAGAGQQGSGEEADAMAYSGTASFTQAGAMLDAGSRESNTGTAKCHWKQWNNYEGESGRREKQQVFCTATQTVFLEGALAVFGIKVFLLPKTVRVGLTVIADLSD